MDRMVLPWCRSLRETMFQGLAVSISIFREFELADRFLEIISQSPDLVRGTHHLLRGRAELLAYLVHVAHRLHDLIGSGALLLRAQRNLADDRDSLLGLL